MMKLRRSGGATLLEVMLVLAVAAMIIVMSIKYYKNAQNSQNANQIMAQINSMVSAADQIAQGNNGSYATVSTGGIAAILGSGTSITNPYGNSVTISGTPTATSYTIDTGAIPYSVCTIVKSMMASGASSKLTSSTTCGTSGSAALAVVYTSTS